MSFMTSITLIQRVVCLILSETAAGVKAKAAAVAQSVEHILGKDEVIGSIPICSSIVYR